MDLPKGWAVASLGDMGELYRGVSYIKTDASNRNIENYTAILRANNISNGLLNFDDLVYVPSRLVQNHQIIKKDDIVICMSSGSKSLVGKAAIAKADTPHAFGAFCGLFKISQAVSKTFVAYSMHSLMYRHHIEDLTKGTNINNLKQDHIYSFSFPLPPLAEQHRIVAKIDALFSELDKGVETLQTVRQQLRTYRQAVLKWAFEDNNIKIPKNPLKQLCTHIVDCPHSTPKWTDNGKLCLRTTNFRKGYLNLNEKNFVSVDTFNQRIQRLKPEKNDVLYSREGAILGLACLVPDNVELCLGQRMMLMRTNKYMLPRFLMHYLNSPQIETIVKRKTGGTASPHVNVGDVKMFEIPTPSIDKQSAIISEIESRLSVCDKLEQIVDENLTKAAALRQSILKKAFAGQLVPQDTNDEPAEKLLKRIKAERAATTKVTPAKRNKR